MALRSIGKTTISLGLLSVPVKIYAGTTDAEGVEFNLLHAECKHKLSQQYVCAHCDLAHPPVVPREGMVKGAKVGDRYVTFTADELKTLTEPADETMPIVEFVSEGAVNPIYFEKVYYLSPEKGAVGTYALLSQAMVKSGKEGIAKYTARGKQRPVLLRPIGETIAMFTLRYADEVRTVDDVPIGDLPSVNDAHLDLAVQLIEQNAAPGGYDASKHVDAVKVRVKAAIEAKAIGAVVEAPAAAPSDGGRVVDLMAALKASLKAA